MQSATRLSPNLFPSAIRLLAESFYSNPAHVCICPDELVRLAQLEWMLGANLRLQPSLEASFCLARDSVVDAMGFWTKRPSLEIETLAKIRADIFAAPLRLGLQGVRRLLAVTAEIDAHLDEAIADRSWRIGKTSSLSYTTAKYSSDN